MEKVLCIDDDPYILKAMKRLLRGRAEVITAESGEEGLDIISSGPSFAVILCDRAMPSMDGPTFFAKARLISPDSVRIMLTGSAESESIDDEIKDAGVFRFITKPSESSVIIDVVQSGIARFREYSNK